MKHTQEQLEAMSDFELSKIIAMMSKYSISFDINSWSDMGPLLRKNNITIVYDNGEMPCAVGVSDLSQFVEWDFDIKCFDDNELRAAAIVYILIKQGE